MLRTKSSGRSPCSPLFPEVSLLSLLKYTGILNRFTAADSRLRERIIDLRDHLLTSP
jgi:hypothetical protein